MKCINYRDLNKTPPHPSPKGRVQNFSRRWGATQVLPLGEDLGGVLDTD